MGTPSIPRWPPEPYGMGRGASNPSRTLAPPAKVRGGYGRPPMPELLQAAKAAVGARSEEQGKGGADEPRRHLHKPPLELCLWRRYGREGEGQQP
jgi:hypothetical protein